MDKLLRRAIQILCGRDRPSFAARTSAFLSRNRIPIDEWIHVSQYTRNWIECRNNKESLRKVRARMEYHVSDRPLISVIIPTFNRAELLARRAIPSVLRQTYQNFELIIVGDHCTDNTEEMIRQFDDRRMRFHNLARRGEYPKETRKRWLVAGVVPSNKGLELARGEWIAHLDDDDEFSDDHLEVLLDHALKHRYEMVYGVVEMEKRPGKWVKLGSWPLQIDKIAHLSVLYHSKLRLFKYDINAWKIDEPDDWNLFRRMKEAGVRIGFVDKVVGKHYLEQTQPRGWTRPRGRIPDS